MLTTFIKLVCAGLGSPSATGKFITELEETNTLRIKPSDQSPPREESAREKVSLRPGFGSWEEAPRAPADTR